MAKARRAIPNPKVCDSLDCAFRRSGRRSFSGHAFELDDPTRIFTIDVLVDGSVIKTVVANEYQPELAVRSNGDGYHGFSCSLSSDIVKNASVVEARLSNLDRNIGTPISISAAYQEVEASNDTDHTQWLGGLRFSGSISHQGATPPILDVAVDGERVLEVKALGWAHIDDDGGGRAVRAFDFYLPERFADGRVHRVTITGETGAILGGTPLPFVAFADGLAKAISRLGQIDSERLRGELFDLLLPMSIPMSHYEKWRERFPIEAPPPAALKAAIILVGAGKLQHTLSSLEDQTHDDWIAAPISGRQAHFESTEARSFLDTDARDCAFVIFGLSGSVFDANALARIADAFQQFEDAQIVYGDIDLVARDGRLWPLAFPAFDYERMLEQGYCAHLFAMRYSLARQLLVDGSSDLYRLFNSAFDQGIPGNRDYVVHIPGGLASVPEVDVAEASAGLSMATSDHLRERGISAQVVPGSGAVLPAVHVRRSSPQGKTTIIIPTKNRLPLLKRCLQSILPATDAIEADILIIDNGSSEPETLEYLARIASDTIRVLPVPGPFNYARLNNLAVHATRSEFVCLLNNDVEAIDDLWLKEMLGRLAEPDVGAVGALLLWPSGVVQHGGVVLGPSFAAHHAFNDRVDPDPGYGDLLRVAHECSAVTAACMVTRRCDYLSVSGLDETHFAVAFNDVDYCLKLRAAGKRVVFTPHAKLWHLESASRGRDDKPDRKLRFARELHALRAKWPQPLLDDPSYSPALSLDSIPFSSLAWPPRLMKPRASMLPEMNDIPPGF